MKRITAFLCGMCFLCLTGCAGKESQTGASEGASQHQEASAEDSKTEESGYIDYALLTLESYEAYSQCLDSNTLPDFVIRYDDLAAFGAFKSLVFTSNTRDGEFWSYSYTLDDGSGEPVTVSVNHKKEAKEILERRGEKIYTPEDSPLLSEQDIVQNDMRHLRSAVKGEYRENGMRYIYNAAGALVCIRFENEDIRLTLSGDGMLDQYPKGYDTPVSGLLFGSSHPDAVREIPVIYQLCE